MERLPEMSVDLVDELDKLFPSRCPDLKQPDREIWFEAGKRAVVDFLLTLKQQKRRKALPSSEDEEDPHV